MKRKVYNELLNWKNNSDKKPLMVFGARQVGKTYIIEEFCKTEYENYIYVNLFNDKRIIELYKNNINSDETYSVFKSLYNFEENSDTIIFIDEIQESPEFIEELKYLCENHNDLNIVVAGSLLGVKIRRSSLSFPVGKVTMINMYPMDFEEFLLSINKQDLIDLIRKCYKDNVSIGGGIHELLLKYYRFYQITGGMPEAVKVLVDNNIDIINYDTTSINYIITSYINDMGKYTLNNSEKIKIINTYKSAPNQLANSSNKFQYNKIVPNAKSRDYELPIDWLIEANLLLKCSLVTNPSIPLAGFVDNSTFKLYMSDIGILSRLLELDNLSILEDKLSLYKGVITENYVANHLLINCYSLYYWASDGKAKIDFVIQTKDGIIPIEVKSSDNTKSKSLKVYMEKFKPNYAIRISAKDFGYDKVNSIKSVPLYAVFCIKE